MPCRRFEDRIQELLDERLEPSFDSELMEHAGMCAECRDLLETQSNLFEGLASLAVPGLSADFSRHVLAAVATQRSQPNRRYAPTAAFLAMIATLLLVVALGPRQRQSIGPKDDVDAIASASADQQFGRVGGLSIADFDTQEVRLAIEQFLAQLTSADAARFYQVDQLTGTIGPLASTLNVAFDAIRRSIPRHREPARGEPQAGGLRDPSALQVI